MKNVNKTSTSMKNWATDDQPREKIKSQLGNLEYELQLLNQEKNKVIQELYILEENFIKAGKELQEKYGEGALNLKTGEFKNN